MKYLKYLNPFYLVGMLLAFMDKFDANESIDNGYNEWRKRK